MRRIAIILLATIAGPAAAQTINRCNVDGKIVLQQGPCAEHVESVRDSVARKERAAQVARDLEAQKQAAQAMERAAQAERERAAQARMAAAEARKQAICKGKTYLIQIGLTRHQLLHCTPYGDPHHVNTTHSVAGTREQFVYRDPWDGPRYVYLTNGIVTAYQD